MNKPTVIKTDGNVILYYYNKDNRDYLINVHYAADNN